MKRADAGIKKAALPERDRFFRKMRSLACESGAGSDLEFYVFTRSLTDDSELTYESGAGSDLAGPGRS